MQAYRVAVMGLHGAYVWYDQGDAVKMTHSDAVPHNKSCGYEI